MKTLDDLSEQIQEDVVGFLGGAHLNFSEDRQKDMLCHIIKDNIKKYKVIRGKQIEKFSASLTELCKQPNY